MDPVEVAHEHLPQLGQVHIASSEIVVIVAAANLVGQATVVFVSRQLTDSTTAAARATAWGKCQDHGLRRTTSMGSDRLENFPGFYLGFQFNAHVTATPYWKPIGHDRQDPPLQPPLCGAGDFRERRDGLSHGSCYGMMLNTQDVSCQCAVHDTLRSIAQLTSAFARMCPGLYRELEERVAPLAGAFLLGGTVWSTASCSTTEDGVVYSCKSHLDEQDQGESPDKDEDRLANGGSLLTYYDEDLVNMVGGEFCLLPWGLTFQTTGGWSAFIRSSCIPHNTMRGRCSRGRRFCSALFTHRKLIAAVSQQGISGRTLRSRRERERGTDGN
eukprot:COSAG02_NODE_767_length_17377_cov_991.347436_1_plen_328_part_00